MRFNWFATSAFSELRLHNCSSLSPFKTSQATPKLLDVEPSTLAYLANMKNIPSADDPAIYLDWNTESSWSHPILVWFQDSQDTLLWN
jgi:hypothetical protein